ncbi:MAG: hypothetical protein KDD38_00465 [Bdellovibrionales bacterium]|nr:hypothetical protein [Bdellovibrionales bacterium]
MSKRIGDRTQDAGARGAQKNTERNDFAGEDIQSQQPSLTVPGSSSPPQAEQKVAVILGPGGYKSFAHAGVLKELNRKNIPIHKIVGIEWGALVAGLYAQRGQINEAEWKLYKLERLDLNSTGFFVRKKESQSIKVLTEFLRTNLDLKDISKSSIPFFCPSLALTQGTLIWQERGLMSKAVENCLSYPPLFNPVQPYVAALFSLDSVITRLKNEGYTAIILVNVLGDGNLFDNPMLKEDYATAILWNEARRSLWAAKSRVTDVIDVNTRGVHISDFESRKLLVTAGEASGEKAAKELATKYGF